MTMRMMANGRFTPRDDVFSGAGLAASVAVVAVSTGAAELVVVSVVGVVSVDIGGDVSVAVVAVVAVV